MYDDESLIETLGNLERALRHVQEVLEAQQRWEPFRADLVAFLDGLDGDVGQAEAGRRLRELLARHGITALVDRWENNFRGGSHGGFESFTEPSPLRGGTKLDASVSSIRKSLGAEKSAPIPPLVTYPELQVRQEVIQGSIFPVRVAARASAPEGGGQAFEMARTQPGPVDLEVEIVLPRGLELLGSEVAVLRIPEKGDSAAIVFDVKARELGSFEIEVILRHGPAERLVLRSPVLVRSIEDDRALATVETTRAITGPVQGPIAPAPYLALNMRQSASSGDQRHFRVSLQGDGSLLTAPASDIVGLAADSARILTDYCLKMHELMPLAGDRTRENRLRGIGFMLGKSLLPSSIRQILARPFPEGTPLHIESDDAWAPWEAVAIDDDAGGFFLGERFAITRWLRQGLLHAEIAGGPAMLVVNSRSGLESSEEAEALRRLTGADPRRVCDLATLQDGLSRRAPKLGFLHFACHGLADPNDPLTARLKLEDDDLRPVDVPDIGDGAAKGPLAASCVFVNACEADIPGRRLSGQGGWAEVFLEAGAAAVIAPAWSITDRVATSFAKRFYAALEKGSTVGAAARAARLEVRREGDPDRLAHAVYAAPWTRLPGRARPAAARV